MRDDSAGGEAALCRNKAVAEIEVVVGPRVAGGSGRGGLDRRQAQAERRGRSRGQAPAAARRPAFRSGFCDWLKVSLS
jgi:hypothetical protein